MGVTRVYQPRGSFLSAVPPAAPPPPRVSKAAQRAAAICAALVSGPLTMREIRTRTTLTSDQVRGTLYDLRLRGVIEPAGSRLRTDRVAGASRHERLYRLVGR